MAVSSSTNGADTPFANITHFCSLIGALQYLAITRPDIQFAVNRVAQRMHQPSEHYYHCLKRILRYIFDTLGRGLLIRPGDLELRGFSDSDWANDKNDIKSTSRFLIFLGPNLISWCIKKQPKKSNSLVVFVAVYVDDIVLTGTDTIEITQLKMYLDETFKIKDLGRLHYFSGMEILDTAEGVLISQRKFVLDLLKKYECSNYTSLSSPLDPNVKLRAKEGNPLPDPTYYRKLVGKLNFLTNTRMDIAFSVQQLSQFMQDPRLPHLQAAFHLLRYIKQDPTLGVYLSRNSDCTMRAYCDSD
uniref:Reverse transcriptase Ty1/copia-type domain-containing protein n=1 Tax=Solanum lycopersicum TaxID=4081 RepID=A0A3Q7FLP1_SOLLC